MEDSKEQKRPLPPYIAYKTFKNYIERFKIAMPARIDRSVLTALSGAQQGQLLASLAYLRLINENGVPNEKLAKLANSEGVEHQKVLKDLLTAHFPFLFKDGFDLTRASPRQIEEQFANVGMSGDTVRKGVSFFISAAKEAGISVSPYIKGGRRTRSSSPRLRRASPGVENNDMGDSASLASTTDSVAIKQLLLAKFPSFDPAWSPDVQSKWFEAFDKLMAKFDQEENGEEE